MTPIRNVSDRERQLCAEIDGLLALHAEQVNFVVAMAAERDALKQANSDLACASIIQEGYQLVPIEPTGEMWSASRSEFIRHAQRYEDAKTAAAASIIGDIAGPDIYKAMLAAAKGEQS